VGQIYSDEIRERRVRIQPTLTIIGAAEFVARAGRRISRPIGPRKTKAKLEALLKRMHPPNDSSSPTG